ncbi:MAG: hypothetical protein P8X90_36405 [Desulfobacterales bacterium]
MKVSSAALRETAIIARINQGFSIAQVFRTIPTQETWPANSILLPGEYLTWSLPLSA